MINELALTTGAETTLSRDTWPHSVANSYETVIVREGKSAIDAEFNEQSDILTKERAEVVRDSMTDGFMYGDVFGDGSVYDSYVTSWDGTNVSVAAGRARLAQRRCDLSVALSSGVAGNGLSGFAPPAAGVGNFKYIYVDVYRREYTSNPSAPYSDAGRTVVGNDPYNSDPTLGGEQARRIQWFNPNTDILFGADNVALPVAAAGHTILPTAKIYRDASNNVAVLDLRAAVKSNGVFVPGASTPRQLTISGGSVLAVAPAHSIEVESGTSDTLTNLGHRNFVDGNLLILNSKTIGHTIVMKNAAGGDGQLHLAYGVDVALTTPYQYVVVEYVAGEWYEVSRSFGDPSVLGYGPSTALVIASNTVTPISGNHTFASAGSVNNILNSATHPGALLLLQGTDAQATTLVAAAGGSGQIITGDGNVVLASSSDYLLLRLSNDGLSWGEVFRSDSLSLIPLRDNIKLIPGYGADTTLTIAGGTITPTAGNHAVDTEGGAGADDLANVLTTNLPDGHFVVLRAVNGAHVVTIRDGMGGAGQLHLANNSDMVLDATAKMIGLKRNGADWYEAWRSVPVGSSGQHMLVVTATSDFTVPNNIYSMYGKIQAPGGGGGGGGESNHSGSGGAPGNAGTDADDAYVLSAAYKARGGKGGQPGLGGSGGYAGGISPAGYAASLAADRVLWGSRAAANGGDGGAIQNGAAGGKGSDAREKIYPFSTGGVGGVLTTIGGTGNPGQAGTGYGAGGGGGSGGRDNGATNGGGGGSGGTDGEYAEMAIPVTPGQVVHIQVPDGGLGGTGGTGNLGGDGGVGGKGAPALVVLFY